MTIKALLVDEFDELGLGLNLIRKKESELVDISSFGEFSDDSDLSNNIGYIIKDNKAYKCRKTYFDLDKNIRIVIAVESTDRWDKVS